jgi:Mannosyltransferase (PIG-V)
MIAVDERQTLPWWRLHTLSWRIAAAALGYRAFSALLAFLINVAFPLDRLEPVTMFGRPSPFWDPFTRYDSGWYYQIARYGYLFVAGGPSVGVGKPGKIAYFPLYPLLMRYAGRLFGRTGAAVYMGGIFVSWIGFMLAMVALLHLAERDVAPDQAEKAVLLAAIFPFSFFFGMVYTESLFLLLTVATIHEFRARRWVLGGVLGALATATRVNGILMLPSLAWFAWRGAGSDTRDRVHAVAGLLLTGCGVGAYSVYVYHLSGNPFEWAASIERWGYYPGGAPWMAQVRLLRMLLTHPYAYLAGERMAPYDTLNGLSALMFVAATPFVWRRLGAGYGLLMLANLWLPLSSGQYEGLGRYCSVMFPFFIWLASIRSRFVFLAAVVVSATLYTLCLAFFTTIRPIF